jgi:choline transport protein
MSASAEPQKVVALESKELPELEDLDDGDAIDDVSGLRIEGFTKRDQKDMRRMGKNQELMRNFRRLSSFSFTVMLTATWEYILMCAVHSPTIALH